MHVEGRKCEETDRRQPRREAWFRSSPHGSEGPALLRATLSSHYWLPELFDNTFLSFKPRWLWYFAVAALGQLISPFSDI